MAERSRRPRSQPPEQARKGPFALFRSGLRQTGSGPRGVSFSLLPVDRLLMGPFLAGFVMAEGTFTRTDPPRFTFAVRLGESDAGMCESFRKFFGVGTVHHYARRKPHYDDEVVFQVR